MRPHIGFPQALVFTLAMTLGVGVMSSCEQFSLTEVKNPNVTDQGYLKTADAAATWVRGVHRQFLTSLNTLVMNAEILSDDYYNNYTTNSKVFDRPELEYYDMDVSTLQYLVARLREVADFGLESVLPADSTSTVPQQAELLFYRGVSNLWAGEFFVGLPTEPQGEVVAAEEHLRAAIADFEQARSLATAAALKNRCTLALARAHYRLGNQQQAVTEAQALLTADPTFIWNAIFDGVDGPTNTMQGLLTSSVNNFQPLPRLDFLDPKFPNRGAQIQSPLAFLKAEEAHMIIAEGLLASNNLAGAKTQLTKLLQLVQSRPKESVDSRIQKRGRAGGVVIYPNTSDTKVAFSPGAPLREGFVLTRSAANVTVPTVSGTSVTQADIDALATLEEGLYTLYLMRQEIFLGEGRRATDLGLRAPVSLTEILANPQTTDGEWYTEGIIPAFIPLNTEMDGFTYDPVAKTCIIKHDMNRVLVQNRASPYVLPFHK